MEARGFFETAGGLNAAPMLRVGIGFGRGLVVAASALIDTGADVCVFPTSLFPWPVPGRGEPDSVLEMADGTRATAPIRYPSVTAGDIRETAVASAILPDVPPILGRSFLNRFDLRVAASRGLVRLETVRGSRAAAGD